MNNNWYVNPSLHHQVKDSTHSSSEIYSPQLKGDLEDYVALVGKGLIRMSPRVSEIGMSLVIPRIAMYIGKNSSPKLQVSMIKIPSTLNGRKLISNFGLEERLKISQLRKIPLKEKLDFEEEEVGVIPFDARSSIELSYLLNPDNEQVREIVEEVAMQSDYMRSFLPNPSPNLITRIRV